MNTMVDLAPRLLSVFVLILIIYYCFAIIGMEFLYGKVEQGCCIDALYSVGDYFKDNSSVTSQNVYYLNNFDNILQSYGKFICYIFLLLVNSLIYILCSNSVYIDGSKQLVHYYGEFKLFTGLSIFYHIIFKHMTQTGRICLGSASPHHLAN